MKSESLVIAGQHTAVNTFSEIVHTARHTTRVCNARSAWPNHLGGGSALGGTDDWGKVVTRYPYGNVGMDHLLSREKEKHDTSIPNSVDTFYSVLRDLISQM